MNAEIPLAFSLDLKKLQQKVEILKHIKKKPQSS